MNGHVRRRSIADWTLWVFALTLFSLGNVCGQDAIAPPSDVPVERELSESIQLKKVFVPVERLPDFMRGQQAFLPLSATRFQSILDTIHKGRPTTQTATPISHWISLTPTGGLQGYSLIQTRLPANVASTSSRSDLDAWVSFEGWNMPCEYFNLVPVLNSNTWPPSWEYQEVPVTMSVNEHGQFGLPRAAAETMMLARYNSALTTQADASGRRLWRLPNSETTQTTVRYPSSLHSLVWSNGEMFLRAEPQPFNVVADETRTWQIVTNDPEVTIQLGEPPTTPRIPVRRGRYVEHGTMNLNRAVARYSCVINLEFLQPESSELIFQIPALYEITDCEVNNVTQVFKQRLVGETREIIVPWQTWQTSNAIRLIGSVPIQNGQRVTVPRVALTDHHWLQGNLQVTIEPPLGIVDYELVESRLVNCQSLGQSQNLSFQWGGPKSHVTLLLDTDQNHGKVAGESPAASFTVLNIEQDSVLAEQWMLWDYRHRTSNLVHFTMEAPWQIEQMTAWSPRELTTSLRSPDESQVVSLNWFVESDSPQRQVMVTLPDERRDTILAVRVRAVQGIAEWPAKLPSQVLRPAVATHAPDRQIVELRGQASAKLDSQGAFRWQLLTTAEAGNELREFQALLGSGTFWSTNTDSWLTLENENRRLDQYSVSVYTRNQMLDSGVVRQWHRLFLQPTSPLVEVELETTGLGDTSRTWKVFDQNGEPYPGDVDFDKQNNKWLVRFRKPITVPISILLQQDWIADSDGEFPLVFASGTTSQVGWVDSVCHGDKILNVYQENHEFVPFETSAVEFRQASRQWLSQVLRDTSDGSMLVDSDGSLEEDLGSRGWLSHAAYQNPNQVRYQRVERHQGWSGTRLLQATQTDYWQATRWQSHLNLSVFSDVADTLAIELPENAVLGFVRVGQQVVPTELVGRQLQIEISAPGTYDVEVSLAQPARQSWYSPSRDLPAQIQFPIQPDQQERSIVLPETWYPESTAGNAMDGVGNFWWGWGISRRFISPLIWAWREDSLTASTWQAAFETGDELSPSSYRQWWQTKPGVAHTLLINRQNFDARLWVSLVCGIGLAWVFQNRQIRIRGGNIDGMWLLFGLATMGAFLLPFIWAVVASTVLMGQLIGHSLVVLRSQFWSKAGSESNGTSIFAAGEGGSTSESLVWSRASLGLWVLGCGAYFGVGFAQGGGGEWSSLQETGRVSPETSGPISDEKDFHPVVIPVDADQRPIDSVVYISPDLYQDITRLSAERQSSRDLEVRSGVYTLEFDPQLHLFSTLTTQFSCKTDVAKVYSFPVSVSVENLIRQVRVNGLATSFQRSGNRIEVFLDAAMHTVSITYDLQSARSTMLLETSGLPDASLVVSGVPNQWYVNVTDTQHPTTRFRSTSQRRFRVDRIQQLHVELATEAAIIPDPAWETRLTFTGQRVDCETWFFPQRAGLLGSELSFQADPRLSQPTAIVAGKGIWRVESDPRESKSAPYYRLIISPDHPPDRPLRIRWEFAAGRSYGRITPPWVRLIHNHSLHVRYWNILNVPDQLVFHVGTIVDEEFRRASEIELPSSQRNSSFTEEAGSASIERVVDGRQPTVGPSEIAGDVSNGRRDFKGNIFVFEALNPATFDSGRSVGRIAWQPTQVFGNIQQQITLGPRYATTKVTGENQITHGELAQFRFRVPSGSKIRQFTLGDGQRNEIAWWRQFSKRHWSPEQVSLDEVLVVLKTPLSGTVRFELLIDAPLVQNHQNPFPWIQFPSWPEVVQTLLIESSPAITWYLESAQDDVSKPSQPITSPMTMMLSPETASEIGQWNLNSQRKAKSLAGHAVFGVRQVDNQTQLGLRLLTHLDENRGGAMFTHLELTRSAGLGLPVTLQATSGSTPVPVGTWVRTENTYRLDFAEPVSELDIELVLPISNDLAELVLPQIVGSSPSLSVTYFEASVQEAKWRFMGELSEWDSEQVMSLNQSFGESPNGQFWDEPGAWSRLDTTQRVWGTLTATTPTSQPEITVLADRLYLTNVDDSKQAIAKLTGIQNLFVRTAGRTQLRLEIPSHWEVQQAWVDSRLAPATGVPSTGDVQQFEVALDPVDEYTWVTLLVAGVVGPNQPEFSGVKVAGAKGAACRIISPLANPVVAHWANFLLAAENPTGVSEDAGLMREILAAKTSQDRWKKWVANAPGSHPVLLGVQWLEREWDDEAVVHVPSPYNRLGPEIQPMNGPAVWPERLLGLLLLFCFGYFGLMVPKRFPSPEKWGDWGWLAIGVIAWFGGASFSLLALFVALAGSFFLLRLIRHSFSARFA